MKKKNKSKLVIATIVGLAGVSVATVGFSTWLVGINRTELELHVSADVDNTVNDSIFLEAVTKDEKFVVAEKEEHSKSNNDIIGAKKDSDSSGITVSENALQFTFTTLQYRVGKGYDTAKLPTKMKIELMGTDTNTFNKVASTAIKLDEDGKREGSDFTYLAFSTEITLDATTYTKTEASEDKTYDLYDITNKEFTMEWGTFFGGKSPVNFYNSIYSSATTLDYDKATATAEKAYQELAAMNTALKGKDIKVKVSLVLPE